MTSTPTSQMADIAAIRHPCGCIGMCLGECEHHQLIRINNEQYEQPVVDYIKGDTRARDTRDKWVRCGKAHCVKLGKNTPFVRRQHHTRSELIRRLGRPNVKQGLEGQYEDWKYGVEDAFDERLACLQGEFKELISDVDCTMKCLLALKDIDDADEYRVEFARLYKLEADQQQKLEALRAERLRLPL
jgi:hypothetical protein